MISNWLNMPIAVNGFTYSSSCILAASLQDGNVNHKHICMYYISQFMLLVLALVLLGWAGYPAVPDYPARYPTLSGKKKPNNGKVCRIIRPNIWHLARKTRSGPTLVSSFTECNINFLILIHLTCYYKCLF